MENDIEVLKIYSESKKNLVDKHKKNLKDSKKSHR